MTLQISSILFFFFRKFEDDLGFTYDLVRNWFYLIKIKEARNPKIFLFLLPLSIILSKLLYEYLCRSVLLFGSRLYENIVKIKRCFTFLLQTAWFFFTSCNSNKPFLLHRGIIGHWQFVSVSVTFWLFYGYGIGLSALSPMIVV